MDTFFSVQATVKWLVLLACWASLFYGWRHVLSLNTAPISKSVSLLSVSFVSINHFDQKTRENKALVEKIWSNLQSFELTCAEHRLNSLTSKANCKDKVKIWRTFLFNVFRQVSDGGAGRVRRALEEERGNEGRPPVLRRVIWSKESLQHSCCCRAMISGQFSSSVPLSDASLDLLRERKCVL